MAEWFDERYISREEHQKIVDYYKKLVVQLHRQVTELRVHIDTRTPDLAATGNHDPGRQASEVARPHYGGNVISLEDRRRARMPAD